MQRWSCGFQAEGTARAKASRQILAIHPIPGGAEGRSGGPPRPEGSPALVGRRRGGCEWREIRSARHVGPSCRDRAGCLQEEGL